MMTIGKTHPSLFLNFVVDLAIAESERKALNDQKNYEDIITVTTTKVHDIFGPTYI